MMRKWIFLGLWLIALSSSLWLYETGAAEKRYKLTKNQSAGIATILPLETEPYAVKTGDNLYTISKKVGISVNEIKRMNRLNSSTIRAGQVLILRNVKKEEKTDEEQELADIEEATGEWASPDMEVNKASESVEKWNSLKERSLIGKVAKAFLGAPYQWGGDTLKGLDCSAFVKRIYEIFNINLPRTTWGQLRSGEKVGRDDLEEGDLVFFNTRHGNGTHVGIYVGKNEFVHASYRKKEVKLDTLNNPYFNKSFLRGMRVRGLERDI